MVGVQQAIELPAPPLDEEDQPAAEGVDDPRQRIQ